MSTAQIIGLGVGCLAAGLTLAYAWLTKPAASPIVRASGAVLAGAIAFCLAFGVGYLIGTVVA